MKIFTAQQMKEVENQAYQQGASEEAFMEQAGAGIAKGVKEYQQKNSLAKTILLLCAKGNNSGDAYVAGRYLLEDGFSVQALQSVSIDSRTG